MTTSGDSSLRLPFPPVLGLTESWWVEKKEMGKNKMKWRFLWWSRLTLADARTSCIFPMFRSNYSFVTRTTRSTLPCPPRIYCCFWFVFVVFYPMLLMLVHNSLATVAFQSIVSHGCQRDQLHRCVKTAEPLLRNPDYVVPATLSDVSTHCRSLHSADTSRFSIVTFLWWKLTTGNFFVLTLKNRDWIYRLHQRLRHDLPDKR